jgi:hypothetical protein
MGRAVNATLRPLYPEQRDLVLILEEVTSCDIKKSVKQ